MLSSTPLSAWFLLCGTLAAALPSPATTPWESILTNVTDIDQILAINNKTITLDIALNDSFRLLWIESGGPAAGTFPEAAAFELALSMLAIISPMSTSTPIVAQNSGLWRANLALFIGGLPINNGANRDQMMFGIEQAMIEMQRRTGYRYGTFYLCFDGRINGYVNWRKFTPMSPAPVPSPPVNGTIAAAPLVANTTRDQPGPVYQHVFGPPWRSIPVKLYYPVIFKELMTFAKNDPNAEIPHSDTVSWAGVTLSFNQQWLGKHPPLTYGMGVKLLAYAGQLPYLLNVYRDLAIQMLWEDGEGIRLMAEVKLAGTGALNTVSSFEGDENNGSGREVASA